MQDAAALVEATSILFAGLMIGFSIILEASKSEHRSAEQQKDAQQAFLFLARCLSMLGLALVMSLLGIFDFDEAQQLFALLRPVILVLIAFAVLCASFMILILVKLVHPELFEKRHTG